MTKTHRNCKVGYKYINQGVALKFPETNTRYDVDYDTQESKTKRGESTEKLLELY